MQDRIACPMVAESAVPRHPSTNGLRMGHLPVSMPLQRCVGCGIQSDEPKRR